MERYTDLVVLRPLCDRLNTATTLKSVDGACSDSTFSRKHSIFHHTNRSGDSTTNNDVNYLAIM
jgi:hypothetical protein